MKKRQLRKLKKALLLQKIKQQRADLVLERNAWLSYTAPFDKGWLTLFSHPKILAGGVGILAVFSLRHPRKLLLWSRRALGIWSTVKFVRSALNLK